MNRLDGWLSRVHPVAMVALLALAAIASSGLIFYILSTQPGVLGQAESYHLGEPAMSFLGLQVEFQHLELSVPYGHIVPVLRAGEVAGVVILGQGWYILGTDAPDEMMRGTGHHQLTDTFGALFSPISYPQLENLRYRLQADEVPGASLHPRVHAWLEHIEAPASLDFFGIPRRLYIEPAQVLLHLMGDAHGQIVYQESPDHTGVAVTFTELAHYRLQLPSAPMEAETLDTWQASVGSSDLGTLLALVLLLFVLFFCLIAILTLDLEGSLRVVRMGRLAQGETTLLLVFVPLTVLVHAFVLPAAPPGLVPPVASWIIPLSLALFAIGLSSAMAAGSRGIRWVIQALDSTALRPVYPARSLLLGAALGWLTFMIAYGAVPAVDQFSLSGRSVAYLLWAVFTWGVCQELLYRSYLQTSLQRWLGPVQGLAVAALVFGLAAALPLLTAGDASTGQFIRQALVLSPLTALISGYLLHRTGDIWAASLARGIYVFLAFTLIP